MATIKVTKGWIEQYFGIRIDRPEQYSSYWQTDGGTATQDFDRLPEDEYEVVHRSSSKTYWGKYVHPTVPPPPFGAEQHIQRRTATYGEADRYKKQIIAGWKAGASSTVSENIGFETVEMKRMLDRNWKHLKDLKKRTMYKRSPTFQTFIQNLNMEISNHEAVSNLLKRHGYTQKTYNEQLMAFWEKHER